jgi:uncharacterized cupin superfamily protein
MDISFTTIDRASGERFQRLRAPLGVTSFGINLLTLEPGQRGRIHAHERQEEVYVVLEGTLTLAVEGGEEHELGPDTVTRVGKDVRRQLVNAGSTRVLLLALGGYGTHESRDGRAWEAWDEGGPGRPPQEVPLPEDLAPGAA